MKSKVLKYFKVGLGMLGDESGTKPRRIKVAGKPTVETAAGKAEVGPAAGLSGKPAAGTAAMHSRGGFAITYNYAGPSPILMILT